MYKRQTYAWRLAIYGPNISVTDGYEPNEAGGVRVLSGPTQIHKSAATTLEDNYTITIGDFGKSFRMISASDKTFTLPSVDATHEGARLELVKCGAGRVTGQAVDSDKIGSSSAGGTIFNDVAAELGATVTLEYVHSIVTWVIKGMDGTWVTT